MKRTTVYLDSETEVLLKLQAAKRKRPAADLIREAVRSYFASEVEELPGIGAFDSGRGDTASDVDAALDESGFGDH